MDNNYIPTAYDEKIQSRDLNILKTALPYMNGSHQKEILMLIKSLELKKSLALLLGLLFWNAKISSALTVESLYFMAERLLPQPVSPPEMVYLRSAILLTIYRYGDASKY